MTMALDGAIFCNKFRFYVLVLGTLCLAIISSNMLTINMTLVCMDPTRRRNNLTANAAPTNTNLLPERFESKISAAALPYPPVHLYTQYEKTLIQWAVSLASMAATFPFSWLCTRYGAKYLFLASGVVSALSNALIPLAADLGLIVLLVVRVFQGLAYACDFAVIGALCTHWASLRENAKFIGVLTCFTPLSSSFNNLVSGLMCDTALGWPWAHYVHAIITLALFGAWAIFYTDDPRHNKFVSAKELKIIHQDKSEAHKNRDSFVPYKVILKSKVIWTVWLNAFVDLTCGFFIAIYLPVYFVKVLLMNDTHVATFGAFVFAMNIPVKLLSSYASDAIYWIPEPYRMWMFNSVALLVPAILYFGLAFMPSGHSFIVVALFAIILGAIGFNAGGFYKCGALASRQYAEFVIACTQFIKCTVFFVAPALMAIFVSDESKGTQWHVIFFIIAVSLVMANFLFCIYATDKPCGFTQITRQTKVQKMGEKY